MIFKKISAIFLTVSLIAGSIAVCPAAETEDSASLTALGLEGSGTSSNPYIATDEETFKLILDFPNAYWELANDIVLTSEWGYQSLDFSGNLDGNGYTISGIVMTNNSTYSSGGFFSENSGTIKNLNLEGKATYTAGHHNDAFFVNKNYGTIENCSAKGTMKLIMDGSKTCSSASTGGFCYHSNANGIIQNCYSKIAFTYSYINSSTDLISKYLTDSYIKGFLGSCTSGGTVRYCYSASYLTNSSDSYTFDGFYTTKSNSIINNYYDNSLNGVSDSVAADGKSTTAMKMQATYSTWDFDDIWAIDSTGTINDGYPYLRCEQAYSSQNTTTTATTTTTTESTTESTTTTTTESTTESTTEAETEIVTNSSPNVYVSVPSGAAKGSQFDVSINLNGVEEIIGMEIILQYDSSAVEYVSYEVGSVLASKSFATYVDENHTDNQILITYTSSPNLYDVNGEILTITFKALETGETAFTLPSISLADSNLNDLTGILRCDGILTISDCILGDVTGDEKVNYKDAAMILQYAAGLVSFTDVQKSAADFYADGLINYKDAAYILMSVAQLI